MPTSEPVSSKRNLLVLASSLFMLASGMSLVSPILPIFIKELGNYSSQEAAKWSGIIQGATFLTAALMSPIWGMVGDKYGRKSMVLRAFFGMSVTMGLVSIAQTPMQILIIRLIHGSLGGAMSASIALASIMTKEKKMASTISFLHAMIMAGTIGGPLIGGVLADAFGFRLCFLITSCILIVCGILIAVFVEEDKTMLNTGKQFSIRENFSFFFHKKGLVTIAVIMMLAQAGRMGLIPILPLFIETIYQKKELLSTITGSVFGAAGLAAAISAAYWGKRADKKGFRSTLVLATAISTGIFAVFPFSTALWQIYALRTLLGLFASGVVPILQSMVALHTPPERRGSMLGTVSVAHWTGNALGPITTGITAQFLGFEMSFAFLGVLTATSLVLILMGVKDN